MKNMTTKILTPILVNAEEMHRSHPDSFWIPKARNKVKKGDSVKVRSGGERFWTLVESFADGIITAKVDNRRRRRSWSIWRGMDSGSTTGITKI